jgi:HPt (histidine-containing phosphotransfer) domain-containing protein
MNLNKGKKYTDLTYLRSVSKGNTSFEQKMLSTFVQQVTTDMEKLRQAWSVQDWETIRMIAHKMKPSLQFVGLHLLQADMHDLEMIAKQRNDPERTAELVSSVTTLMSLAVEEIKDELISFNTR